MPFRPAPSALLRFGGALVAAAAVALVLPNAGEVDGWSLYPPLAAIFVAVASGRLLLGLASALFGAAIISLLPTTPLLELPWAVLHRVGVEFIWTPFADSFQLYILAFTAALIGMVRVIALAGGTQGIAQLLARRAEGGRSARLATFFMGLAIFFDDYSNTLVVGTTIRPIADRFGIPREKLAYIIDSTAAPVAGIALVSTWIGYEVSLFEDSARQVGAEISGYALFFKALPARFYCFLTLFFVGLTVFLRRDFGPMLKAEKRALGSGQVLAPGSRPPTDASADPPSPPPGLKVHWLVAALPVGLVIGGVLFGMQLDAWSYGAVVEARQSYGVFAPKYWMVVFANADGAKVMFLAAIAGSLAAFLLALTRRRSDGLRPLDLGQVLGAWLGGIAGFRYALIVLVLAWAIKEACTAVHTSAYLVASLSHTLAPELLPLLVFGLSSLVAFSIGTSWTTMALVLPTVMPLAHTLGGVELMSLVGAAVLDGAIFGDHCSPISDTTVLSSIASSCDHIDHVKTQIPYALTTMAAAAIFGYLGTSLFYSPVWGLLLGAISLVLILLWWGKRATD